MSNTPDYLEIHDERINITLKKWLDVDGAQVKVLTMREPTVEDNLTMDAIKGSDAIKEINYFANLCQVSPEDIKKLTQRDYGRLQKAYQNFID